LPNLSYRGAANTARLAAAVVDEIGLLKISGLPICAHKITQRAPAFVYGGGQYTPDRLSQPFISRKADPVRRRVGIDPRFEQAFRRVDISDAHYDVSGQQHLLDSGSAAPRLSIKEARGEPFLKRLDAQLAQQCVAFKGAVPARMPEHGAEAAWICQSHQKPAGDEIEMVMLVGRRSCRQYAQMPRHAEVNDERALLEIQQQIFPTTSGAPDRLAHQLLFKTYRKRPAQADLSLHDAGNDLALDMRCNAAPGDFNFRQFRHGDIGSGNRSEKLPQGASMRAEKRSAP
jgi:hypothetical protein